MASLAITPSLVNQLPEDASKVQSNVSVREIHDDVKDPPNQVLPKDVGPSTLGVAAGSGIKLRLPAGVPTILTHTIPLKPSVTMSPIIQSHPVLKNAPVHSDALHLTSLGVQILSSSVSPVASVSPPHEAVLVKAGPGSGTSVQQAAVPVISISNATPPQNQDHAKVWQDALQAAQTNSPVVVNSEALKNPSVVSADANQKMFKISLTDLVNAPKDGHVVVTPTAAPLLAPAGLDKDILAKIPLALHNVELPEALQAHTSATAKPQEDLKVTTPPGFVLTGDSLKVFGLLDAERFTFHGNASPDGKTEIMIPTAATVTLDQIFGLDTAVFGGMTLSGTSISMYPEPQTGGRKAGLWLDATLAASDKLQELAGDLKSVLGQTSTELQVSGWLGPFTTWSTAPTPPEQLTLQGSVPQVNALLGKYVTFASADIACRAAKGPQTQDGKQTYTWSYDLSGNCNLTTPGSITPLLMEYSMTKSGTQYALTMHLDEKSTWNDAMGVHGMQLVNVDITNVFDKSKIDGKDEFDLKADFKSETANLKVAGYYRGDDWSLSATCPSLTWDGIDSLFNDMFGHRLQPFHHQVSFNNLNLVASSVNKDISLSSQMTINDWSAVDAEIRLSSDGFHLSVSQMGKKSFQAVDLQNCKMAIFVGKVGDVDADPKKPGTASSFTVSGEIAVGDLTIDAVAYLNKESTNSALAYVVYAECEKRVQLSTLVKSSVLAELDLALDSVVVIAANTDKAGSTMPIQFKYPVKEGFFLSAQVDAPQALTKALHMATKRIGIELELGKGHQQLDFVFDSPQALVLKKGMSAPVVTAGINFEPISLFVKADMPVLFTGQTAPEIFELRGEASLTKATLEASLQTPWVNPFGVSPNVTILAPFGLGVVIDYASATYPSGLQFTGGIQIGETQLHTVFDVTDSPTDGVIFVEAEKLGIKDVIAFASKVIEHDLPQPSTDFFEFEDLKLGMSTGAYVDDVFYPPGVTFAAAMLIFGKVVKASAQMIKSPSHLSITGSIEAFTLGPLAVTGYSGKDLSLALEFGKDLQQVSLDGHVRLWELEVGVTLMAKLNPLDLLINADLDFSDVLKFHIDAKIDGQIQSLKEIGKCDFAFEAFLEQHIVDYIMAHANTYILTAKKAADEGIDSAKSVLASAQKKFDDLINQKEAELDAAKALWDKQNAATVAAANARKASVANDEARARQAVVDAKAKFDAAIARLQARLNQTKQNAAAEIQKAAGALNSAKTDMDNDINSKVRSLQQTQASFSNSFGNADAALTNAINAVNSAQQSVNSKQQDIDNANRDLSNASWLRKVTLRIKVDALQVEKVGLDAGLRVAQLALAAAKAIVDGPGYQLAKASITAAQAALDAAKKVGDATLTGLQVSLDQVTKAQNALVDAAVRDLAAAQKECDESKLLAATQKALDAFLETKATLIADADKAVAALEHCVEKIAYDAATTTLAAARAGTKEIDVAKDALKLVSEATDVATKFGTWMVNHTGNIFRIDEVNVKGKLSAGKDGTALKASFKGMFADKPVDMEDIDFTPGKAEEMLKTVFQRLMDDAKKDIGSFVKML